MVFFNKLPGSADPASALKPDETLEEALRFQFGLSTYAVAGGAGRDTQARDVSHHATPSDIFRWFGLVSVRFGRFESVSSRSKSGTNKGNTANKALFTALRRQRPEVRILYGPPSSPFNVDFIGFFRWFWKPSNAVTRSRSWFSPGQHADLICWSRIVRDTTKAGAEHRGQARIACRYRPGYWVCALQPVSLALAALSRGLLPRRPVSTMSYLAAGPAGFRKSACECSPLR